MRLKAMLRNERGKRSVRKMRAKGLIPAVVYGPETEPLSINLNKSEVEKLLAKASEALPVGLEIKYDDRSEEMEVFIKKVQVDKVTDEIVHIDFYKPAKGHTMKINVPIRVFGKAIGVEKGGILEIVHNELPVETLPSALIDHIEIDVTHLELGQSVHVKDLRLPSGMKALLHPEEALVTIVVPRGLLVEEAHEAVEVQETAEPEVIKKGKKEEEED
ncbi:MULTISPECIES: 50S ribosomal protein L25 [Pseudothermotoga]|uniref:Large ribosomal subunit protein bL25 n=1 Tax=Pseudothermotoga lettingae (strain ATCC BAA-301 / DSM 14385 / NBRC 107922 / TMO) TaxID=416591 RepID=A8F4D6_PSELT|nr:MULTISPECIES: 50S ribosomal protein L25 [Pseudothermotoga]ABV33020.1 ribosomal 5S rRNA E-loop binding protein Ctc/L25/TL5 [Pseudothermotoga lettingae TMO]KUK22080.1 MAG: 50S ribosomal protein L25 [Pseudothermotoga lettingae]MDI3494200.1 large subunit ribosomal protein [Pseudothermotoga sp.]MDK2884026.1 large subunit ribosomal protein [Pseudothermotoga sp.]GLI47978.1 50S ribosomal protein L25 [Pseudothermotoga lettingae TMO]